MSDPLAAAAALARIPGLETAKARYRHLGGGLTSSLWLVEADDRKLVLRLDTPHTRTLGLDRRTELAVLRTAAAAGIAPEIVHADPDAGVLVYTFLRGRSWTAGDLASRANLEALAALLSQVHALPRSGIPFDALGAAERYLELLQGHEALREFARRCRDVVAQVPAPAQPVCCHNDVVAGNIVATPALKLIDWEYAADNDAYFDLACLAAYHDLDERQAEALLGAYAGAAAGEARERFALQRRLFDPLQWLWLAVRQILMPHEQTRERLRHLAARIDPAP